MVKLHNFQYLQWTLYFYHKDVAKEYTIEDIDIDNVVVVRVNNSMDKEEVMDAVLAEADKYFTDM